MKKLILAAMIGFVAIGTMSQPAEAFFYKKHFFFKKHFYKKVHKPTSSLGSSHSSWVPKYVFAATTCSALLLWIEALHTSQTQRRELTQREAWTTVGNCFLPIIGGQIMGSMAQQP